MKLNIDNNQEVFSADKKLIESARKRASINESNRAKRYLAKTETCEEINVKVPITNNGKLQKF